MSSFDAALATFEQEAGELLEAMEDALLSLESTPDDSELLNSVFRAIHTIKGSAGLFGFNAVVDFTHAVEAELEKLRSGLRSVDAALIHLLLKARDQTSTLVELALEGKELPDRLMAENQALLEQLCSAEGDRINQPPAAPRQENWILSLGFGENAFRNGVDPISFIRYLSTLGEVVEIMTLLDRLPPPTEADAESCYLGFRIALKTEADKQAIEEVFEFAEDDCTLQILAPDSKQEEYLHLLESITDTDASRLGEILINVGALTEKEVAAALALQESSKGSVAAAKPLGEILVEQQVVAQPVLEEALHKQQQAREKQIKEAKTIRVDAMRLGQLLNLVGELVISSAGVRLKAEEHDLDDLKESVAGVEHLVEEIRENAQQLRMVQIGETFSRFRRVVRDVARDLGKEIKLEISGGESELDKAVVEKLTDPLTHLVRNALDHGIEPPEVRQQRGKPRQGKVTLSAVHDSGHIVIQIQDDGGGLDADRIRQKGVQLGLIRPDQILSRREILRTIFEPGLSTKQEASNLSGRGVGMDVVRRNIEALRGNIDLDSEPGIGTTFTIHLPLTLAIIEGFRVGVGAEQFVLPLALVEECIEAHDCRAVSDSGGHRINLRGEALPFVRLRDMLKVPGSPPARESLVVVHFGSRRAGFIVDHLFGELHTVIKPLGRVFENTPGISGATVLGSGDIALVLDVPGLIDIARRSNRATYYRNAGAITLAAVD